MNGTVLNVDVLLLIFSLAHQGTKLALMSTCQVLYREGGKQFLKSVAVTLDTENRVKSFVRFMKADGGSRMRSLRTLDLDLGKPSKSVAEQLTQIINPLTSISQLTDLSICYLEPLLFAHPPLSRAIARLTSIEDINLGSIGKLSLKMLKSMQSKLKRAEITMWDDNCHRLTSGADGDAIMFLRRFSSSLRNLDVVAGCATADPQDDAPQYPLLSALRLEEPVSPVVTWHYVRAFPNLKKLIITISLEDGTYEADGAGGAAEVRAGNVAQLRERGCWEALDTFEGTLLMLWLLGLPCPVRVLRVCDDCGVTPDMLRDVLCPARATQLDITFYEFSLFLDGEFTRAFVEGCGATLEVLSLTLEINRDEYVVHGYDLDLGDVLDAVMDMLRAFSALESVALYVDFDRVPLELRGDKGPVPAEVYVEDMDVDAMCAALREAVPSADCVQFTLQDHWKRGTVTVQIGSGSDAEE
ncbi:hypothetical protein LXA43DRAFT_1088050 [Ganoderma leucocontextum]|nr:hypothetical protein LXA43DRAFT_1088050 [Ganoderma leucocontextum]